MLSINIKTSSVFKRLLFRIDNKQAPKELCMTQCIIIQKHSDRHEEHAALEEQGRIYQKERGG